MTQEEQERELRVLKQRDSILVAELEIANDTITRLERLTERPVTGFVRPKKDTRENHKRYMRIYNFTDRAKAGRAKYELSDKGKAARVRIKAKKAGL